MALVEPHIDGLPPPRAAPLRATLDASAVASTAAEDDSTSTSVERDRRASSLRRAASQPLLLRLISIAAVALTWVCVAVALPAFGWMHLTRGTVLSAAMVDGEWNADDSHRTAQRYMSRWPLRWVYCLVSIALLSATIAACFVAPYLGMAASVSLAVRVSVAIAALLAGALALLRGMWYINSKYPRVAIPAVPYIKSVWSAQLDLGAFVLLAASAPMLVRAPHYKLLRDAPSAAHLRRDCAAHFLWACVDACLAPLLLLVFVSWRRPALYAEHYAGRAYAELASADARAWSMRLRAFVFVQFVLLLLDALALALCATVCLVSPVRLVEAIDALVGAGMAADPNADADAAVRAPPTDDALAAPHAWIDRLRSVCLDAVLLTVRDVLAIPCALVLLATVFRVRPLLRRLGLWRGADHQPIAPALNRHAVIESEFIKLLRDALFVLMVRALTYMSWIQLLGVMS